MAGPRAILNVYEASSNVGKCVLFLHWLGSAYFARWDSG